MRSCLRRRSSKLSRPVSRRRSLYSKSTRSWSGWNDITMFDVCAIPRQWPAGSTVRLDRPVHFYATLHCLYELIAASDLGPITHSVDRCLCSVVYCSTRLLITSAPLLDNLRWASVSVSAPKTSVPKICIGPLKCWCGFQFVFKGLLKKLFASIVCYVAVSPLWFSRILFSVSICFLCELLVCYEIKKKSLNFRPRLYFFRQTATGSAGSFQVLVDLILNWDLLVCRLSAHDTGNACNRCPIWYYLYLYEVYS